MATSAYQVLPSGYWWSLLYGTAIALLCLLVCLVGAHIYAKATFIIFIIVTTVLASTFISFFIVRPVVVILPDSSGLNGTGLSTANYSGFQLHTLESNLLRELVMLSWLGKFIFFSPVLYNI